MLELEYAEAAGDTKNKELIAVLRADGQFELDWQATDEKLDQSRLAMQRKLYQQYRDNTEKTLFALGFVAQTQSLSESLSYIVRIASAFIKRLAANPDIEWLREQTLIDLEEQEREALLLHAPFLIGSNHLDGQWIEQLWAKLQRAFSQEIAAYEGSVQQLLTSMNPRIHLAGRVFFHLVESKKEAEYPFSFLATYAAQTAKEVKSKHLPLLNALVEYGENSGKLLELLATVNKASEQSEFISELVESGDIFHPIGLTAEEAYIFLKEIKLYEESGIVCRIPKWWRSKSDSLKISVSVGEKPPSLLGFDQLVDFDAELLLGGDALSIEELKAMLAEAEGLTFIKGKWVEVNHDKLGEVLKAYEQVQALTNHSGMSIVEALRFRLNTDKLLDVPEDVCELEVSNGEWLESMLSRLTRPDTIERVATGDNFHASLRVYQERGLSWLYLMKSLGLGACLADDMGLGKTVQIIALLNYIRANKQEKTLLVVPASLIGNWMSEIAKFAPSLKAYVLHPSENKLSEELGSRCLEEHDLFITTYGMLLKYDWLRDMTWHNLILDEAQAIKNPGTKQTKVVKQIKAGCKIAMTGTPIENRLSDLWSLFDFLNKGLLGTAKEFTEFTKKLKEKPDGYARLKQTVSPFILRRLKTDKTVISDLPDKIEMKTYASLNKKQIVLYNKLVKELTEKLEAADEGIERKGLVLASLMKLKQICNHPDQYLGQSGFAEEESGKFDRLREICGTICEKRERVLVFTQFKEMTGAISAFLEQVFQHKGLVLHGETAVSKRKELVARFQGEDYIPFMVLSIKAGGVGLNLTNANHVIHFDRWWNPAVENQATDRAFRIGQLKNVIVHKFITRGTIEEKIDQLIEEKTKLSNEIVPDIQENWITELDNEQLMNLFKLSV
ncbi:DEAD/DEAH box helicase [Paenibacillus alkaliterrae]|uniref:DEAD/DEAH box helicase n=1 Tax=Paenibacillus alkaliterrae TaxID=320909 RepID=UPI001F1F0235|nr:DEAD/DEAH box helicase [Paenibacillus alkaliterrae]MCF2940458.1 DEAD/DEAH box helicase [Paenibacillus alkaliterrae]